VHARAPHVCLCGDLLLSCGVTRELLRVVSLFAEGASQICRVSTVFSRMSEVFSVWSRARVQVRRACARVVLNITLHVDF
jgi:hypothetical protein